MLDALGVAAREVVEVVVHARHDDGDVARGREVAEHLGGAAVAGRVEEQEVAVRVVELAQLAQARVVVGDAVGAQARDLAVDRLGVGRVAERDRRAVEVADQLRALVRERVGDVRVQTLEERRHSGRIGVARDQALEVARGALHRLRIDARGRAAAGALRRRSGRPRARPRPQSAAPGRRRRARSTITATSSSTPTYSAVTCPRSRRSMARACRGAALWRQSREAQLSGWARPPKLKPEAVRADENPNGTAR